MYSANKFPFAKISTTSLSREFYVRVQVLISLAAFTYVNKDVGRVREGKGGFPLSRKFYVRTDVNLAGFTYVNEIRSDV